MVQDKPPFWISRPAPTVMVFPGLTRCPLRWTLPPLIASTASWRVLKKRAAQSHLSNRIVLSGSGDLAIGGGQQGIQFATGLE